MIYRQYPVHPALRNWIRYFWSYDAHTPEVRTLHIRSFADRYPRLIYQDIHSSTRITETNGNCKPVCYLSGIDTIPTETYWESRFSHFGVSFHPHALHAIFGIHAGELTDQTPDISWIEKNQITNRLIGAKSHAARVKILEKYFFDKISCRRQDGIIAEIFGTGLLDKPDDEIRLYRLIKQHRISERQMQRRFKQQVGVSARKFGRLSRFEKSLEILARAQYGHLTDIAYELGYADQSHFIHDFKLFSGLTPLEFIRNQKIGSESSSFIYWE